MIRTKAAAGRAPKAALRKSYRRPKYTTSTLREQGFSTPRPGTFLCDQLRRYRSELAALPYSPEVSRLVDCCTALIDAGEVER